MKPLKDTKVGQWLKNNAPQLLETVGGFVPAPIKGTMNFIKNAVGLIPGMTPDKIEEFNGIADEHEVEIIKLHNEEMANARSREISLAKTTGNKYDWTLMGLALIGVLAPLGILAVLLMKAAEPSALVAGFIGVIVGSYTTVFSYYFGSSSGSAKKQDTIDTMMQS